MKKILCFHILGLNLKFSYQIASLFDMYIHMGERIAGKQDAFEIFAQRKDWYGLWLWCSGMSKLVGPCYFIATRGNTVMAFRCPWHPWILCKGPKHYWQRILPIIKHIYAIFIFFISANNEYINTFMATHFSLYKKTREWTDQWHRKK